MPYPEQQDDLQLTDRVVPVLLGAPYENEPFSHPPSGLFRQIEEAASVQVDSAPVVVEYSIDCDDVVMSTGGDWAKFASENDAEELAESPPRLSLWSQIQGEDARSVWKSVVSEVRRSDSAATVPFRCDGPAIRRWYEIDVSPADNGSVDFRSRLVFEEKRPEISLLDRRTRRESSSEPIQMCCWCARGRDADQWTSIDELLWSHRGLEKEPAPEIVQGICGDCARSTSAEVERLASGPRRSG